MRVTIRTTGADQTVSLGESIGKGLGAGDVVALTGDLGAGKTTMTRGIAAGIGVTDLIHSPTFTVVHEHNGRIPLYHIDLYRLCSAELESIGFEEYLEGGGVTVIEWAERADGELPEARLNIDLRTDDSDPDSREVTLETNCDRLAPLLKELADRC